MVSVIIQNKPAFNVIGLKTWISGTDNDMFGKFWKKCHADGDIDRIREFRQISENSVTKSDVIGLSDTEKDPNVREFYFYVCVETDETEDRGLYEILRVKPYRWAIFSSVGKDIDALMECEMYAWKEWLPNNGTYIHDNGPEMEIYFQENRIEYWLPIREK